MIPSGRSCHCQSSRGVRGLAPPSASQASRSKYSTGGPSIVASAGGSISTGTEGGEGRLWARTGSAVKTSAAAERAQNQAAARIEWQVRAWSVRDADEVYCGASEGRREKGEMTQITDNQAVAREKQELPRHREQTIVRA